MLSDLEERWNTMFRALNVVIDDDKQDGNNDENKCSNTGDDRIGGTVICSRGISRRRRNRRREIAKSNDDISTDIHHQRRTDLLNKNLKLIGFTHRNDRSIGPTQVARRRDGKERLWLTQQSVLHSTTIIADDLHSIECFFRFSIEALPTYLNLTDDRWLIHRRIIRREQIGVHQKGNRCVEKEIHGGLIRLEDRARGPMKVSSFSLITYISTIGDIQKTRTRLASREILILSRLKLKLSSATRQQTSSNTRMILILPDLGDLQVQLWCITRISIGQSGILRWKDALNLLIIIPRLLRPCRWHCRSTVVFDEDYSWCNPWSYRAQREIGERRDSIRRHWHVESSSPIDRYCPLALPVTKKGNGCISHEACIAHLDEQIELRGGFEIRLKSQNAREFIDWEIDI